MTEQPTALMPFYQGWDVYQQHLVDAVTPLTADQLALRASSDLRSIGEIALHIIGARARWLHYVFGEGGEELIALGTWDRPDQPARSGTELAGALETTWQVIQNALQRWTIADLDEVFHDSDDNGEVETFTRQWVLWHLIEHDLHHGGELSLMLGMHHLKAIEL